jgi:cytoskeletal protein CcmA (bactofilin family)
MRRTIRTSRALVVAALVLLTVAVTALPAVAGVGSRDGRDRNRRIAVGNVVVDPGETVDGPLIAIDGRARVSGTLDGEAIVIRGDLVVPAGGEIDGDVLVLRGDAVVSGGTVDGDVVVVGGRADIRAGSVIDGDVTSTDDPRVARDARVTGDVDHLDLAGILAALGAGILLFWWIAVTVSTAVLGAILLALFPRLFEASADVGRSRRWWVALLVGLGLVIGLPIVGIIAITTLFGLPLGLGLLGSLGLLHAVGYVAGAFFLGRVILKRPKHRFAAFFVGWGILRAFALIPGLGALGWIFAAIYGLGTLAVAAFSASRVPRDERPGPDAPPPVDPPPDAPRPAEPAPSEVTA